MKKRTSFLFLFLVFLGTKTVNAQWSDNRAIPWSDRMEYGLGANIYLANADNSVDTNENHYFTTNNNGKNWFSAVRFEIQTGGIGTRKGLHMDWDNLTFVADWDNNQTSGNEHIAFGFDSNYLPNVKEKMRLTGDGKLGIGTTQPRSTLDVNGLTNTRELKIHNTNSFSESKYVKILVSDDDANYISSSGDSFGLRIESLGGNKVYLGDGNDKIFVHGPEFTINHGTATDLTKISFNTSKKVDNAALTIAGATYIGPKAELAASGNLDKFKPEYLNSYNLWVEDGIVTEDIAIVQVNKWKDEVFSKDYSLMPLEELEEYVIKNKHLPGFPSETEVKKDGYSVKELNFSLLGQVEELTLHTIAQEYKIKKLVAELQKLKKLEKEVSELKKMILSTSVKK